MNGSPLPRIALYTPDGSPEFYENCVINSSLIPDLSFVGEPVGTGKPVKILTNLAYKIFSNPTPLEKLKNLAGHCIPADNLMENKA